MLTTLAPFFGPMLLGVHGTALSMTSTTSARPSRSAVTSKPRWHSMVGGAIDVAGIGLHNRDRPIARQLGERVERGLGASGAGADDDGELGPRDETCGLLDRLAGRLRRGEPQRPLRTAARLDRRLGQHLARQRQVHGAARLAHGDVEGTVDDGTGRLPGSQLVVPLHELAHHAALVETLLAPVDVAVARGGAAGFGQRRAASREQDRNLVAVRVHELTDRVGGADRHVHHDAGGLARDAVVAVGHGHRHVLVRHGDELRILARPACQALDDRGKVGPGIGEHVLDAAPGQLGEVGFGGHSGMGGFLVQGDILRSQNPAR